MHFRLSYVYLTNIEYAKSASAIDVFNGDDEARYINNAPQLRKFGSSQEISRSYIHKL